MCHSESFPVLTAVLVTTPCGRDLVPPLHGARDAMKDSCHRKVVVRLLELRLS